MRQAAGAAVEFFFHGLAVLWPSNHWRLPIIHFDSCAECILSRLYASRLFRAWTSSLSIPAVDPYCEPLR